MSRVSTGGIEVLREGLVRCVMRPHNALVVAPPGLGKTTGVPRWLFEAMPSRAIWVLSPRRIAARLAAERIASTIGSAVGGAVGFATRFERAESTETRLLFLTEGLLLRRLTKDPTLSDVGAVVIDEVHERHLVCDAALARLLALQQRARRDLPLVAMSATADIATFGNLLDAEIFETSATLHPIAIDHAPRIEARPIDERVRDAVTQHLDDAAYGGNVLVFLSGRRAIDACMKQLGPVVRRRDVEVHPLTGSMSAAEQDRALGDGSERRIILATNVAESSITVPGVDTVIDSGLRNEAALSSLFGVLRLREVPISQASATQRSGRAGRLGPGRAIRLYTRDELASRPAFDSPEILQAELTDVLLSMYAAGLHDPLSLRWPTPPEPKQVDQADTLLRRLGAIDEGRRLTPLGREMATLPASPRIARLLLASRELGCASDASWLAAALDLGLRAPPAERAAARHHELSDASVLIAWAKARPRHQPVHKLARRLAGLAKTKSETSASGDLTRALLTAFPDRVARLRERPNKPSDLALADGGYVELDRGSALRGSDFAVVLHAEVPATGKSRTPRATVAHPVDMDDVLEVFLDELDETTHTTLTPAGRLRSVHRLAYRSLVLEESPRGEPDPEQGGALLLSTLRTRGIAEVVHVDALHETAVRAVRAGLFNEETEAIDAIEQGIWELVGAGARHAGSLDELRQVGWLDQWLAMSSDARAKLAAHAPLRLDLPSGRSVKVHYPRGREPYVASRMQDFFGMREGPRIGASQEPLLLHLLAPNQRPVQVTTDLAGFWQKHYPKIASELRRRYPKHPFPEDPANATPPKPGGRRRG